MSAPATTSLESPLILPVSPATPAQHAKPPRIRTGSRAYANVSRAMLTGGFATFALLYGMQPLMPVFAREFQLNPAAASGVLSAATGAMALSLIPASLLADRFGRKPVMNISLILSALLTLLCSVVTDFQQLLILRALLGIALAGLPAVAIAYLSEEIDPDVLGRTIGLYIAGTAVGGMFGRFAMALLSDHFSWRIATLALGTTGLLAALEFWRSLPASQNFRPSSITFKRLLTGVRSHFSDAGLPWLFLTGFILMGCFVSLFNYLAFRLASAPFSYGPSHISVIYSLNAAGIFAAGWAGALADRIGRRNVLWIMLLCMLLGILITLPDSIWLIYLGTAILSFGFFGGHSIASSWLGFRATRDKALATALYLSIYYLGSSALGTVTGFMWSTGQWSGVVSLLSALLAAGLLIALKLRTLAPRQPVAN